MLVSAVVTQVFPGPSLSRDGTVDKATDPSTPVQFLELLTLCCCNLQQGVLKITNAAWHCAAAQGWLNSSEAWAAGWQAGSSNIIHPWQLRRSLTPFLQATELPASFCILPHLRLPQSLGICSASHLSLHFPLLITYVLSLPSLPVPMHLFSAPSLFFLISLILPALSILPRLRAKAVPVLEGDNGCQEPAVRAAANCKAAGS